MKEVKTIAIATGGRADWGLLSPLAEELRRRGTEPKILATYAHLFEDMGNTVNEIENDGFSPYRKVPTPKEAPEAVAVTVREFSKIFRELKADYAVILGDRFEMLGVATAALLEKTPIAHIAGGTTSLGAFDESIRHSISKMSTLHFPETKKGKQRLILMGEDPGSITVAGALGVYNSIHTRLMEREELGRSLDLDLTTPYMIGTFHPATLEAASPEGQMETFLEGIRSFMKGNRTMRFILTYPNSDTDPTPLIAAMEALRNEVPERVTIYPSLGRIRYLSAAKHAEAVIGNSSSGIVEIPSLGVPVLDIGDRQKGRERSKAVHHADLSTEKISSALENVLTMESKRNASTAPNPYFREGTPAVIADKLLGEEKK